MEHGHPVPRSWQGEAWDHYKIQSTTEIQRKFAERLRPDPEPPFKNIKMSNNSELVWFQDASGDWWTGTMVSFDPVRGYEFRDPRRWKVQ